MGVSYKNRRIGLLGGSFNPAHAGHLHLSLTALKLLKLDEVWWLLSPQNPLKSTGDLAPYETRLKHASAMIATSPKLRISDIEQRAHLRYTSDTLRLLKRRYRGANFVWLMGADNLAGFHRWRRWREIFHTVPVAVFDRAPFSHNALNSRAALTFSRYRLGEPEAPSVVQKTLPAWVYIFMKRHPAAATDLRKTLGKGAFLGHNRNSKSD